MNFTKTIRRYVGIIMGILFLVSCSDFLDKQPLSQISEDSFYKTTEDFNQAVVATYEALEAALVGGGSYFSLLTDLRSDNGTLLTQGGSGDEAKNEIDRFETTTTNEHLRQVYLNSYNVIQRTNLILAKIDNIEMSQTVKDQYVGEAKAVRGYVYFNLVRLFGKLPLVLQPFKDIDETYKAVRSSVEDVYSQIKSDLSDAANLLPSSYTGNNVGRTTEGAARSILGTVYLTLHNYEDAVQEFNKVIQSGEYDLLPEYIAVFDGDNQGNREAIWQILYKNFEDRSLGSPLAKWYAPNSSNILENGRGFGFLLPTHDLKNSYESGDIRRDLTISDGYTDDLGNFIRAMYVKYYAEAPVDFNANSSTDWNIIRYADVLLRYAEALNEQNNGPTLEAYNAINKVRERAKLSPLSNLSYEEFKKAVYHEERVESPFEGKRWFDLIRTGRAIEVMNSKLTVPGDTTTVGVAIAIQDFQLIYPLPEEVVLVGLNIEQNPGY